MSVEAATKAVDTDRVTLALLDHLLGGARKFSRAEAAARSGVDESIVLSIERMAGIRDGQRYSETEIRQLSLFGRLLQVLPEQAFLEQIRGDIPMLRTMAMRTLGTMEQLVLRTAREQIPDPVQLAIRLDEVSRPLLDISTDLIGQSYRRVILSLLTSDMVVRALRDDTETLDLAVGFVDVVGYTSLSGRIDPTGLVEVLNAFEHSCQSMAEEHPQVQLVKFLGDAGMFISLDAGALARGLFWLVQEIQDDDQALGYAPIKGGMAAGPVLMRGGDYFGTPVNEAARLTDLARRNSVLVSDALKDHLDEGFKLRRIRPVRLHGIGMRRPYALRDVPATETTGA